MVSLFLVSGIILQQDQDIIMAQHIMQVVMVLRVGLKLMERVIASEKMDIVIKESDSLMILAKRYIHGMILVKTEPR